MKLKQLFVLTCFFIISWMMPLSDVRAQIYDLAKRDSLVNILKIYDQDKQKKSGSVITTADTARANLLWQILSADTYMENPDDCINRLNELKKISYAINYQKGIANAMTVEGSILFIKKDCKGSIELNKKALAIREKINDKPGIMWSLYNIGLAYHCQGLIKESMIWFTKSLKLAEVENDKILAYFIYNNFAGTYESLGQFGEAAKAAVKATGYAYALNNTYNYGLSLAMYAYYLSLANELDKADSALIIVKQIGDSLHSLFHLSYYHNVKAAIHESRGNYGEAVLAYIKSNAMEDSMKSAQNKPYSLNSIAGDILKADKQQLAVAGIPESKKYDEVIRYAQLSLDLTIPFNIMDMTADNYKYMSSAYEAKGDVNKAYSYFKMSIAIKDSLYSAENTKTIEGIKTEYETEKKEQQIELLNKDKMLQHTEIAKQKTARNSFIGGFILVLLLVGVIYNRYRLKQKSNVQLSQALTELTNTQQQLLKAEKMAAFGVLASRVAHEIQNPLNFVNNFSELSKDLINDIITSTDEQARNESTKLLSENIQKITFHGKRAENIVTALQQHIRAGTAHEYFEPGKS